jgi:hypothetical protein
LSSKHTNKPEMAMSSLPNFPGSCTPLTMSSYLSTKSPTTKIGRRSRVLSIINLTNGCNVRS